MLLDAATQTPPNLPWRGQDLPSSRETLLPPRTRSFDPGRTERNSPSRPIQHGCGSGNDRSFFELTFEAQSHGSAARCLRFAAAGCPAPAQDSLAAVGSTLPRGIRTRWISSRGFSYVSDFTSLPPLASLLGAIPVSVPCFAAGNGGRVRPPYKTTNKVALIFCRALQKAL